MEPVLIRVLKKVVFGKTKALDLSDPDNAKEFAETLDDVILDDSPEGQMYEERLYAYMAQYRKVMAKPTTVLYRTIVLSDLSKLNLKHIGTHWSFEEEGAGAYGLNREAKRDDKHFTFTGVAQTKDIDWEYGLTSFMWYGEDQWECALKEGSKVKLTHIDGEAIKKPINAVI